MRIHDVVMTKSHLKDNVLKALKEEIQRGNDRIDIPSRASGSAKGLPFEEWAKKAIENYIKKKNLPIKIFLQEEFIREIVDKLKSKGHTLESIEKFLRDNTWWGLKDYFFSKKQLKAAIAGQNVEYQQSIADLVIFYGDDLIADANKIIAINVKSHELRKGEKSRHPNIISAKRLLEHFNDILDKNPKYLEDFELWFIGIYYEKKDLRACISQDRICLKDLFKLKVSKIPEINFDAAIQLQWHIKEMEEDPKQTKEKFIKDLAIEVQKRWEKFSKRRTSEFSDLVNGILEKLEEGKEVS
ncbi:MAG: hypothetical protein DRO98_06430 [Archaeoglobales archaeon]|nr:MAG: hypothetical protein DRO98_06430 [Archaeoglobales archaeon]